MLSRDLTAYDIILVNTSAGKDSEVMLDYVYGMAVQQGVSDRVVAVHCDLGRSEWAGTKALAEKQCDRYGVPMHVISRDRDILHQVEFERGKWMSPQVRFCTSDHKRDQVTKVITKLVEAFNLKTWGRAKGRKLPAVRVLNCIGLRAEESTARRKEPVFRTGERGSSSVRQIDRWLPIHDWTEAQVWDLIHGKGLAYHRAYDLGMPRLSCVFCIFAPEPALLTAGYHNRPLLDAYVAVETRIGHAFKYDSDTAQPEPLIAIQAKLEAGWVPAGRIDASLWKECA
ncbi:MAG TPA: phosphoadenosine phosphosulfate reductase family protein [bacterium]|nr:phosphoadenosine phosphosulfate reductase family protein [bacterium]